MIGRKWIDIGAEDAENYFISDFIERALPEDEIRTAELDGADEYLSMFIDQTQAGSSSPVPSNHELLVGDHEILQSRFFSSYSELDYSSHIGMIRLTLTRIPVSGMQIFMQSTTLIGYVMDGSGDVTINSGTHRCKKYDCFCLDCAKTPQLRAHPGQLWECAFIRVNGIFQSELFESLCEYIKQNSCAFMTFGAGARFRSIIWELLRGQAETRLNNEALNNSLLLGLFLELDMAVTRSVQKPAIIPDVILSVQNYLDKNYSKDINLDNLAKEFSISKFHMSREFKRYIGKSPIDYLIDVRIARAKDLLYDSGRQVSDICRLVGIPNPNHFLYLFKEREGVTPTAFRSNKL